MTDKHTNTQTDIRTFQLIERIGPEGRFFENRKFSQMYSQSALDVIDNIAFPSSRNKGKFISPPFTEDEFTRSPPVALSLPTSDVSYVFPRLSQTSPIELIFGGV